MRRVALLRTDDEELFVFRVNSFFILFAIREYRGAASQRGIGKQKTASRGNSITYARAYVRAPLVDARANERWQIW